jgi:tetratricopeptide (TPR) repeat protein
VQTIRNPQEAMHLAQKAAQLTQFNNEKILDTLAAAYACQGQFKEAAETSRKAISLAQVKNDTASVEAFTARLELYQKNLPYTEQAPAPTP